LASIQIKYVIIVIIIYFTSGTPVLIGSPETEWGEPMGRDRVLFIFLEMDVLKNRRNRFGGVN
jgi:hypothetical protein